MLAMCQKTLKCSDHITILQMCHVVLASSWMSCLQLALPVVGVTLHFAKRPKDKLLDGLCLTNGHQRAEAGCNKWLGTKFAHLDRWHCISMQCHRNHPFTILSKRLIDGAFSSREAHSLPSLTFRLMHACSSLLPLMNHLSSKELPISKNIARNNWQCCRSSCKSKCHLVDCLSIIFTSQTSCYRVSDFHRLLETSVCLQYPFRHARLFQDGIEQRPLDLIKAFADVCCCSCEIFPQDFAKFDSQSCGVDCVGCTLSFHSCVHAFQLPFFHPGCKVS